jgi:hypothetical protein
MRKVAWWLVREVGKMFLISNGIVHRWNRNIRIPVVKLNPGKKTKVRRNFGIETDKGIVPFRDTDGGIGWKPHNLVYGFGMVIVSD